MKISRTFLGGLLLAALLVMSFDFHSISALEESRRGKDQNSIGGMDIADKRSQPLRERRAVKKKFHGGYSRTTARAGEKVSPLVLLFSNDNIKKDSTQRTRKH